MERTVINGPAHGEKVTFTEDMKDGDTISAMHVYPLRRVAKDQCIIHTIGMSMRKFQVFGAYAYYLGETLTPMRIS